MLNDKLMEKRKRRQLRQKEEGSNLRIEAKAVLMWENLCCDAPGPSVQLILLKDICGYVRPGN